MAKGGHLPLEYKNTPFIQALRKLRKAESQKDRQ